MSYFSNFAQIDYDFTVSTDPAPILDTITDLTQRIQLKISDKDLDKLCNRYIIQEGETPERIAYNLYGSATLHWTILYVNRIADIYAEWPLSELALVAFCKRKYGEVGIYNTHHFEKSPEMLVMDKEFITEQIALGNFGSDSLNEITNYDYEDRLNELKRFIKVLDESRISSFVDLFTDSMTS